MKIEVVPSFCVGPSLVGPWHVRLVARNGKIMFSGETYETAGNAM